MVLDLFGQPVRRVKGNGYAGDPGRGPQGETCGTCRYFRRAHALRSWHKCGHPYAPNSHSAATDILVSAPACEHWEPT